MGAFARRRTALKTNPRHVPSLCNLGLLLVSSGQAGASSNAEAMFERALHVDPEHVPTLCNYGRLKQVHAGKGGCWVCLWGSLELGVER